ncbi:MAG: hypothetical protein ACRDGT_10415 [Candidatus Limnocylindria bacterium]
MKRPDNVESKRTDEEVARSAAIPMPEPGDTETEKAERMEGEREVEREEGLTAGRRRSSAAPSDRPENKPPHPQDVNEIGE